MSGEICNQCFKTINSSVVRYQEQPYHGTCFVCFHCRSPLAGKTFQMRDQKKVCKDCNRIHYAKRCQACRQYIEGTVKFVTREEGIYHSECFCCSRCRQPLAGKTFTEHDSKLVCDDCYHDRYAQRCNICKASLEANVEFVKYEEKLYHNECFVCQNPRCRKPLSGTKFALKSDGRRMCMDCC